MSWVPLLPDAAPKGATPAVTLTVSGLNARVRRKMTLTIRSGLIEGLGAWWKPGAGVSVECGAGEHAGLLRLTPQGAWQLIKPAGASKAASILLPPLPGAPDKGCSQVPLGVRHGADWIEVALPGWARAAAKSAKPAQSSAFAEQSELRTSNDPREPSMANSGYIGISERVPDPAKAIQAANGGRVR